MKLSKSLKISNFADDNELLIHSPYWTSLVTCESVILTVISRPMFNLETLAPSLPPDCLVSIWIYFPLILQLHYILWSLRFHLIWLLKAPKLFLQVDSCICSAATWLYFIHIWPLIYWVLRFKELIWSHHCEVFYFLS